MQETAQLIHGVDVRDKARRLFGDGGGQWRYGEITASDCVAEDPAQRPILHMPVAGDGPAAGEKRCHLAWFQRADVRAFTHKTGEGPQPPLIAFKILAQAFPKFDVLSDQLRKFHSKPPRLMFATSRSPVRFTFA